MELETVTLGSFTRLLHPYPTFLVTCGETGAGANVITIAWLIPVSVQPPLLTLAVRRERASFALIQQHQEFVVNVVPYSQAQAAMFCGRRSGREIDKIATLDLATAPGRVVGAPALIETGIAFLECRVQQEVEAGDHVLFIAEVVAAYTRAGVLQDGQRDLTTAPPLLHLGGNRFTTTSGQVVEPSL